MAKNRFGRAPARKASAWYRVVDGIHWLGGGPPRPAYERHDGGTPERDQYQSATVIIANGVQYTRFTEYSNAGIENVMTVYRMFSTE